MIEQNPLSFRPENPQKSEANESSSVENQGGSENIVEQASTQEQVSHQAQATVVVPPATQDESSVPTVSPHDAELKDIEHILAEDLGDIYKTMDPALQKKFKKRGEETAAEVDKLMHKTKVKIRKVVTLIARWLKIIPGVNKFFIEQQSKIKADEILKRIRKE